MPLDGVPLQKWDGTNADAILKALNVEEGCFLFSIDDRLHMITPQLFDEMKFIENPAKPFFFTEPMATVDPHARLTHAIFDAGVQAMEDAVFQPDTYTEATPDPSD